MVSVGVNGWAHWGGMLCPHNVAFAEAVDLCDKLGSPKMLFQVKTMQDRASDFLPARSTYYVCRVEFGAPGMCRVSWSPWAPQWGQGA